MQPYFFPYLGYFDLICHTDAWVVFDTPQYIRHGWVNRNRVLHPSDGWQYVIAPVRKHDRAAAIRDVEVSPEPAWRRRLLAQLGHYRKRAPYFRETMAIVDRCLAPGDASLARTNVAILDEICRLLGIRFDRRFFSEMAIDLPAEPGPGDWALEIASALGADEYVNPPGGRHLFDPARFADRGIALTIREFRNMPYRCEGYGFVPGLSIVDVLMWNRPESVRRYLLEWSRG